MPKRKIAKSGFQSIIDNIKSKIMKVTSDKISSDIDNSLSRISGTIIDKDASNYADMVRKTFSDILQKNFSFKGITGDFFQTYVSADRFVRYANSEEIVDCIPYCARALKVLADEIVAPDEISKCVIQIMQKGAEGTDEKKVENNIRNIIKSLGVESYIQDIVYETLKLGDQYIEICDYTSGDIPVTQAILTEEGEEGVEREKSVPESNFGPVDVTWEVDIIDENGKSSKEERSVSVTTRIVKEGKERDELTLQEDKAEKTELKNARLIIHDPRYVIKLQSHRFKMCLGYLILPRYQFGSSDPRANQLKAMVYGMNNYRDMTGIDRLYTDIMATIKKYIGSKDFKVDKVEVKNMIARCIKELEDDKTMEFEVRFVPPDRIEHFTISNRRFFPYGESIFYKSTFASKLLIALETAVTIKRISDSVDSRVFYVETGVPRNAKDVIEQVREARTKKKVSIDKFGSLSSIPSMITSYEDYYVPQTNGKRFLEFDSLPPAQSPRDTTEELKYMRDVLVSGLEVPPSYIGLEENLSNKNALSFENILFARTIISYQFVLSKHLWSLFDKLHRFIYGNKLDPHMIITFSPPKMLQAEKDSEHIRMIAELIESLSGLGIDKEYLKKKYLPVDWDDITKFETKGSIDDQMKPKEEEEEAMGGGF